MENNSWCNVLAFVGIIFLVLGARLFIGIRFVGRNAPRRRCGHNAVAAWAWSQGQHDWSYIFHRINGHPIGTLLSGEPRTIPAERCMGRPTRFYRFCRDTYPLRRGCPLDFSRLCLAQREALGGLSHSAGFCRLPFAGYPNRMGTALGAYRHDHVCRRIDDLRRQPATHDVGAGDPGRPPGCACCHQ